MPYTGELSEVLTSAEIKALLYSRLGSLDYPSGQEALKKIYNYVGSSNAALIQTMPQLRTPCAITWYTGSDWGDKPRRTQMWRIYVVVSATAKPVASWDDADNEAAQYVEDIIDALNREVIDADARTRVMRDMAIEVDPAVAAYEIQIEFRDH